MIYAATIFLSSFLLFMVQPLIARLILPWFGGTAAVWTTCMLFFQTLLLAGYAYAHAANAKLDPRRQAVVHTVLLALALATLPIAPAEGWKPLGTEEPITHILLVLATTVGLPYLLLASTSPLLQAWFARARPGADPYRLFAVSNLASLLALVGYPLVVEPFLGNREQVVWWSVLFGVFAVLCIGLSWSISGKKEKVEIKEQDNTPPPNRADYLLWLALSATGSVLLLAVTNHVTQNVAAIPLLWLAPLTLYLLTFILAFEGGRLGRAIYRVEMFWSVVLVWLAGMAWLLVDTRFQFELWMQLGMFLSGLFVGCMFCHGELYRARPAARYLTAFYLTISAGGAARRPAGRGGGAAGVQRLLRTGPRAGRAGGAGGGALCAGEPRRALGEPRDAAGGGGLRRLRRREPPQERAAVGAQFLRRDPGEGIRRAGRLVLPAPAGARRDHARRAVHGRRAPARGRRPTTCRPRASASRSPPPRRAGR